MVIFRLDLCNLGDGLPAITPAWGTSLAEAGGVCLESQGHERGVELRLKGDRSSCYSLIWPEVTDQVLKCWNDSEVTTEHGAVGVAVLLVKREIGYSVVERSRKGTGFDYWIGDETELPFRNLARLEISGIRKGGNSVVNARVKEKLKQVEKSGDSPAAHVVVVEFGTPLAEMRQK